MKPTRSFLSQAEIERVATESRMRGANSVDSDGNAKDGIEHHPDITVLAGRMALDVPFSQDRYGYDDTEEFNDAQGVLMPGDGE